MRPRHFLSVMIWLLLNIAAAGTAAAQARQAGPGTQRPLPRRSLDSLHVLFASLPGDAANVANEQ